MSTTFLGFDLREDEDLVLEQRPHWIMMVAPVAELMLFIVIVAAGITVLSSLPSWTLVIPLSVFLVLVARFGIRAGRYRFSRLIITNERLVAIAGIFVRRVNEIPVAQVSDLSYEQRFIERLLRFGTLKVEHSGDRGQIEVPMVRSPERIVRLISSQISRGSLRKAGARDYSPLDELSKLAALRRDGSITHDEYEAAKSRLLKQI